MTRARAAFLLVFTGCFSPLLLSSGARAQVVAPASPPRHGFVVLFVFDAGPSFEQAMAQRELRALARAGGAALMTTKVGSGDPRRGAALTLAAGGRAPGDGERVYLSDVLRASGVRTCLLGGVFDPGDPDRLGPLVAGGPSATPGCELGAIAGGTVIYPDRRTELARLGRTDTLLVVDFAPIVRLSKPGEPLLGSGPLLADIVREANASRTLAMFVGASPPAGITDEVTPLVLGEGSPAALLPSSGSLHALRSDTTRRTGLVSNVDVAPTILRFFGIPIPSEMDGAPIETADAPAPFALHRLHLEQRRVRLPLELGEVAFVSGLAIVGVAALFVLARRGSLPRRFTLAMRFATLCGVAFGVALLAGGLLPRMTYVWAVPFLVLTTIVLAALSLTARDRGPLGPFTFLGAVTLGFVVLDGVLGGQAFRVPLFGGTMFDGVRFYGLPNSFIALPLASALFLAVGLDPFRGFLLLIGVGLFCGFPSLGANIGASITLFAAAGLWWVVRTRPRFRLREVAFVAGVVALGLAAVLLANRLAPGTPTHAGRFVERTGSSWHSALVSARHRLGIGLEQIRHVPAAVLPLVGLVVVLILALRPIGPIRAGLRAVDERWPQMIAVLCASSLVAYIANDTGVAAAAPGFLYALPALAYPAYLLASTESPTAAANHGQGRRRVGREAPAGAERSEHPRGPAVNSRRHVGGTTEDGDE